jgi:hypothetical protein
MPTWKSIVFLASLLPSVIYAESQEKQFDINKHSDSSFVLIGKGYGTNVGIVVGDKGVINRPNAR